jgi:hypothetical protein
MAGWNGSGTFSLPYSWTADQAAGINILASRMDTQFDTVATAGFGNTLTRDGQGQPSANLPMNGYKHTGAAVATANGQYVVYQQITSGSLNAQFIDLTAGGNLTVTGHSILSGYLSVTGNATVTGNVVAQSTLTANGVLNANLGASISGAAVTVASGLNVSGGNSTFTGGATFLATAAAQNFIIGSGAPANSSAAGSAGQIQWDSSYLYVCVAANTWKRIALSSF